MQTRDKNPWRLEFEYHSILNALSDLKFHFRTEKLAGSQSSSRRQPLPEVAGSCELPRGYWELNPGPLEEQPVFLTAELSPKPLKL